MKILIWDFNGTIVDDTQLCIDIENQMLQERGMKAELTLEKYKDMFCFPVIAYYKKLGYTFEKESYEELSVVFNDRYDQGFPSLSLVPGCKELLEKAKEKGYQNVICSATRESTLAVELNILGIADYFEALVGIQDDLAYSKIDSAIAWMEREGINPEDCMYIGDTIHDLETAQAIHVDNCILVACGHQSYDRLKEVYDNVVHELREIQV